MAPRFGVDRPRPLCGSPERELVEESVGESVGGSVLTANALLADRHEPVRESVGELVVAAESWKCRIVWRVRNGVMVWGAG